MKKYLFLILIFLCTNVHADSVFRNMTMKGVTVGPGFYTLYFNGVSGYASAPAIAGNQVFGNQGYSVEFWTYLVSSGSGDTGRLMHKSNTGSSVGGLRVFTTGTNSIGTKIQATLDTDGTDANCLTTARYNFNTWHHIVVTLDTSLNLIFYIDGAAFSACTQGTGNIVTDATYPLQLGGRQDGVSTMGGNLGKVRIFLNKVLSQAEVNTLYNGGVLVQNQSSPVAGVTAEYNMDRPHSGTVFTDTSIYANNGSLAGAAAWAIISN
ncbi:exported hypothetical protein [Gammaproteobacteria bacterium]